MSLLLHVLPITTQPYARTVDARGRCRETFGATRNFRGYPRYNNRRGGKRGYSDTFNQPQVLSETGRVNCKFCGVSGHTELRCFDLKRARRDPKQKRQSGFSNAVEMVCCGRRERVISVEGEVTRRLIPLVNGVDDSEPFAIFPVVPCENFMSSSAPIVCRVLTDALTVDALIDSVTNFNWGQKLRTEIREYNGDTIKGASSGLVQPTGWGHRQCSVH